MGADEKQNIYFYWPNIPLSADLHLSDCSDSIGEIMLFVFCILLESSCHLCETVMICLVFLLAFGINCYECLTFAGDLSRVFPLWRSTHIIL